MKVSVIVHEPPLEGKANRAVVEALAEYFKVKKHKVFSPHGLKRWETFDIGKIS